MKKVIIRCNSNYSLVSRFYIIIYNSCNKLYDEYVTCDKAQVYLNKGVYKLLLVPLDGYSSMLLTSFIVIDDINYYNFCLKSTDNSLKITTILVDNNYNNLPIERGKIKLWQDHI